MGESNIVVGWFGVYFTSGGIIIIIIIISIDLFRTCCPGSWALMPASGADHLEAE